MKHRYLLAAVAAGLLSMTAAGTVVAQDQEQEQAPTTCSDQMQTVEAHVMAMKNTRLKARAKKELAAARAAEDKQDEELCMKHLNRANKEVVRDAHARHPVDKD